MRSTQAAKARPSQSRRMIPTGSERCIRAGVVTRGLLKISAISCCDDPLSPCGIVPHLPLCAVSSTRKSAQRRPGRPRQRRHTTLRAKFTDSKSISRRAGDAMNFVSVQRSTSIDQGAELINAAMGNSCPWSHSVKLSRRTLLRRGAATLAVPAAAIDPLGLSRGRQQGQSRRQGLAARALAVRRSEISGRVQTF